MSLNYSVYELLGMFFAYAFLGWCVEVAYCGLEEGHFVNRGFLNGPVCPIYGAGGVLVVLCLTPVEENIFLLFICSALLTSLLELITGFALNKIFHARWWDYSDKPFNIGGYICLKFSVYWGFVCIALMKGIHPAVMRIIRLIPHALGIALLIIFSASLAADLVITVVTINHLTRRMELMEEIAGRMHSVSDKIGEYVYDGAAAIKDRSMKIMESENAKEIRERYEERAAEAKQKRSVLRERYENELSELKEKYAALEKDGSLLQSRIIKAFPNLKLRENNKQLKKQRDRLKK